MKKILGLDLGTNSIGWALIEVDELNVPFQIIAMGSRIIPLDADARDQFQKGQAISKNKDRTTARTQRKGYDRKQLKKSDDFKYSLKKILEKLNIFPTDELLKLPSLDLWKLRSSAVSKNEEISPEQLGRILYMLNQKRGYKSARSFLMAKMREYNIKHNGVAIHEDGKSYVTVKYSELDDYLSFLTALSSFPNIRIDKS